MSDEYRVELWAGATRLLTAPGHETDAGRIVVELTAPQARMMASRAGEVITAAAAKRAGRALLSAALRKLGGENDDDE